MLQPMTPGVFASINDTFGIAYEAVAPKSTRNTAEEVRRTKLTANAEIENIQVTIDGTWHERGHSSLNGGGGLVVCSKNRKGIES